MSEKDKGTERRIAAVKAMKRRVGCPLPGGMGECPPITEQPPSCHFECRDDSSVDAPHEPIDMHGIEQAEIDEALRRFTTILNNRLFRTAYVSWRQKSRQYVECTDYCGVLQSWASVANCPCSSMMVQEAKGILCEIYRIMYEVGGVDMNIKK